LLIGSILLFFTGCPLTNRVPVAKNVTITGTAKTGVTLEGDYDYEDPDGDAEGESIYKWYRSENADGTDLEEIASNTKTYTLKIEDGGYYIFFEVTPVDVRGAKGEPVMSSATDKVEVGPSFEIYNAKVDAGETGSFIVHGNKLGEIDAYEVVIEYDPDYLEWNSVADSLIGGLELTQNPTDGIIHVAVAGLDGEDVQDDDMLEITFTAGDATGTTELSFTEYISEGNVHFYTTVLPEVANLDLSDTGQITIQ
jgi:hypothetical protein